MSEKTVASSRKHRAKGWISLGVVVAVLGVASVETYRLRQVDASTNLPMAPARKGDFSVIVRCRGELKAHLSVQLTAPVNVPDLRIVWAAPPASAVKAGDVVIRFDPSSAKQQLQEKEAALRQAQATLDQELAQARIIGEQDKLDLSTSSYQVEKARLEASKQEIVSALQGEENKIDLGLAEEDLKVKGAASHLHTASDAAKIASLTRLRDHAQADVDLTNKRLSKMELKAPLSGIIVYMQNYSQGWINAKPFQVGDQVWSGASVAEIPDLNTLEMEGKIEEIDRGRIAIGDPSRVKIDALPELALTAKLSSLSPLTEQTFEWPPTSSFRGSSAIQKPDPRLRPGMNGSMDIEIQKIAAAISVPAKALFTRNGKPVVFVNGKAGYYTVEVQILARNPDEIAIKGIDPGTLVALVDPRKERPQTMKWKSVALPVSLLVPLALIAWGGLRLYKTGSVVSTAPDVPITRVKRSDVIFTVTAKAELQGGKSEMLTGPMMGGTQLILTALRGSGDLVKEGDVVAQFDTTEQEYKLKEAEADLAESEEQVAQAQADSQAKAEEAQYELVQAKADLRQAELEARRNPLLASITARQNTLAVEAARDKLRQLEHDIPNRQANSTAGIAIQEAARNKAKVQAETARRNIESMTLKAHMSGYVSVQQNMGGNFFMDGMKLPIFQVGDTVRPGMAVAQIPDFSNWEAIAQIGELDRGHLAEGEKASISVIAIPEKTFAGHVKNIGGTAGTPWDRHFECKIAVDNPSLELRPGMSAKIVITTETLKNVSWIPAQAVFESDGRTFVYLESKAGFLPADIKVVRRSESQVVLTGLKDGATVAMANPGEQNKKTGSGAGGAMQAIPK